MRPWINIAWVSVGHLLGGLNVRPVDSGRCLRRDLTLLNVVVELIDRYNGVTDTLRRAEQHVQRAESAIRPFPDCRAKQDMLAAVRYSAYRDR